MPMFDFDREVEEFEKPFVKALREMHMNVESIDADQAQAYQTFNRHLPGPHNEDSVSFGVGVRRLRDPQRHAIDQAEDMIRDTDAAAARLDVSSVDALREQAEAMARANNKSDISLNLKMMFEDVALEYGVKSGLGRSGLRSAAIRRGDDDILRGLAN